MMRHSILTICASLLVGASTGVAASPLDNLVDEYGKVRAEGRVAHVVDIDNDTLLFNGNDGFYTSGLRYTQTHALDDGGGRTVFGWRIGQELYTASDIKLAPELVGPPNHPYAGWLYGGFFREVHRADGTYTRVGLDLGCLGPCAGGEWTQTRFHRLLNQPLPRGWSRQVRNEAGFVLHGEMTPARWAPAAFVEIAPVLDGRFGNIFTDAGAGFLLRAGQWKPLPSQSVMHAYLRTEVRAVGYNGTLQGGYFSKNNPHTVDPKRLVGSAEAGVVWNREPFGASFAVVRRGNEIKDLPNSIGAQNYVHLQFSYTP